MNRLTAVIVLASLVIGLSGCWNITDEPVRLLPYTPEPFDHLDRPYILIDESIEFPQRGAYFFVIDTDQDKVARRIPIYHAKSAGGDAHLSPNGSYYFVNSAFRVVKSTPVWGQSELVMIDPKIGDIVKRVPLPETTDRMSQIANNGKFLTATTGYEFDKGLQLCLVNTLDDDHIECFYDPLGPYVESVYNVDFYCLCCTQPREDNYIFYIKDAPLQGGAVLYRMDAVTEAVEQIFNFQGLTMSAFNLTIDSKRGRIYVASNTSLIQSPDHDPRYAEPHIEIIDLETKQITEIIDLPKTEELFKVEGARGDIATGPLTLDTKGQKLYLSTALFGDKQVIGSIVEYDIRKERFDTLYTSYAVDFNYMHFIKEKLYLRYNDWLGGDLLMVLNPETGETKWIELEQ